MRIRAGLNFIRKIPQNLFSGSGFLKIPILFISGNLLLLLFLAFHELDLPGFSFGGIREGNLFYPLLFLGFSLFSCFGILSLKAEADRIRREAERQKETLGKTVALLEEVSGFYQSSSVISAGKDGPLLLDLIARESLKCLRAHRAVFLILEEGSSQPKVASVFASETVYESANGEEEIECARRSLRQGRPLLLRESRDFADLFGEGGKTRAVCSLLSVPLIWMGKPLGALTVSLMSGDRKFNEKDLECLRLFSHHAAAAIQNTAGWGKANLNRDFDRELEKIASALRGFSPEEQRTFLERFQAILPTRERTGADGNGCEQNGEEERAALNDRSQGGVNQKAERGGEKKIMVVTPGDESLEFSEEFGGSGLFIRTPTPLELGERFLLRLHNGNGDEPIEVTCKVIWTNQYGKENKHLSRGMGVKFLDLRREDQKKLQNYLRASPSIPEASA